MQNFRASVLILLIGVLIGLGGVAGVFFLLPKDTPTSVTEPTKAAEDATTLLQPKFRQISTTEKLGSDVDVSIKISDLVFPKSTFDRKASLIFWVNALSDDQVVHFLEQSIDLSWQVSSANRTELQTLLLQKLSEADPERGADFALAREEQSQRYAMASVVFRTWASFDLDGAIARIKELDAEMSPILGSEILTVNDDLSLERMREIAREIGDESLGFTHYFANLTKGMVENPRDSWYEIIDIANRENVEDTTADALRKVAVAWVEEQGLSVLDEIMSSISGQTGYSTALSLIVRGLSTNRPEEIFDYVMSNLGDRAVGVIEESRLAYSWARKDPKRVLAKFDTFPTGRLKQSTMGIAVMQWAENNPRELLTRLDLVPPDFQEYATMSAIDAFTRNSPTEAAKFVLQVSDEGMRHELGQGLIRQWANKDANAAKEWVMNLAANEAMRPSLIGTLANSIVSTDPIGAFELALQQPIVEDELGGSSTVGREVLILSRIAYMEDIDVAIDLLPRVRDSGKTAAFHTVGGALISQGAFQQAMDLGDQLTGDENTEYYQKISTAWLFRDPKGILEALDDFPETAKSKVALTLVLNNEDRDLYSDEEVASLEKYINNDDKEILDQ